MATQSAAGDNFSYSLRSLVLFYEGTKMATKEQKRARMRIREQKSFGPGDWKPKHNDGRINNSSLTFTRKHGKIRVCKLDENKNPRENEEGERLTRRVRGVKVSVKSSGARQSAEFFKLKPGEKLFTRLDADGKRMGGMGYRERIEEYKRGLDIKEEKPEEYAKRLYISPDEKKPRFSKEPPFRKKKLYGRWSKNPKYGRKPVVDTTEKEAEWIIIRIVPLLDKE